MSAPDAPSDPAARVVALAASLRRRGVAVGVDATVQCARALALVDPTDRELVHAAGAATLLVRHDDRAAYDAAFTEVVLRTPGGEVFAPDPVVTSVVQETDDADGHDDVEPEPPVPDDAPPVVAVRFSATETLRSTDLAELSPDERAQALRLIDRIRPEAAWRRRRRHRPGRGAGSRIDLRSTLRGVGRTGGEVVVPARRAPRRGRRRVVLLLDVSGSMDAYARALLRFAHAASVARRDVEVFALGTRLTRVTGALRDPDPDRAVQRAAAMVRDFAGGTRLGEVLADFNDRYGVRGTARGAVVVVLSDGWDRGAPERIDAEMGRLARVAHRVVWVNPLKATPGYAPLARGMAAALPHVDAFVEGHSVESLEALAVVLAGRAPQDPSDRSLVGSTRA